MRLKTAETFGIYICNIRLKQIKHVEHTLETYMGSNCNICNIISFCNIKMKHMKHTDETNVLNSRLRHLAFYVPKQVIANYSGL